MNRKKKRNGRFDANGTTRRAILWTAVFLMLFSSLMALSWSDTSDVSAAPETIAVINQRGYVNVSSWLRESPTTQSKTLKLFEPSSAVDVYESVRGQYTGTTDAWYHVRDNKTGITGYIHSPLVTLTGKPIEDPATGSDPTAPPEFEAYLTAQGFPESYKPALRKLHNDHPQWVFQAFHVLDYDDLSQKLTFQKAVDKQYRAIRRADGTYTSRSCVPGTAPLCEVAFEAPLYNFRTNTWVFIDAGGWKPANREMVAYTMDPRTWLSESGIFQFERLSYDPEVQTLELIFSALKGTFMESDTPSYVPETTTPDPAETAPTDTPETTSPNPTETAPTDTPGTTTPDPSETTSESAPETTTPDVPLPKGCVEYVDDNGQTQIKTYAEIFMDAAEISGVNPFFLVQRCITEVTPSGTDSVSGEVVGYESYYNFYNIYAFSGTNPILSALKYARYGSTGSGPTSVERDKYHLPWDSQWRAIVGGASWIAEGYIKGGQDTPYLQKFNIDGRSGDVWHQYMANLYAPKLESAKSFIAYLNRGVADAPFVFKIPVMADMPKDTSPYPSINGNRNNYLLSLNVSAGSLRPAFDPKTYVYDVDVPAGTASVDVTASGVPGTKSTVKNTGAHALSVGTNDIVIQVISESNETREYTLRVKRPEDRLPSVDPEVKLPEGVSLTDEYELFGSFLINAYPDEGRNVTDRIQKAFVLPSDMRVEIKTRKGEIATDDTLLGTGATIDLYQTDSTDPVLSLEIVIFGDAFGDGKFNSNDFAAIVDYLFNDRTPSEAEILAMDAFQDGKINSNDFAAIVDYMFTNRPIPQTRVSGANSNP